MLSPKRSGSELWGSRGENSSLDLYLHTRDSGCPVLLFLALHYISVILIFFKVLLTTYQPVFDYYNPVILNNYLY